MSAEKREEPAWLTDETIRPPYPILRCPRCKKLFDDYLIHICADTNQAAESASAEGKK